MAVYSDSTDFLHAVIEGDVQKIQDVLDRGVNPNLQTPSGSPIYFRSDRIQVIDYLLSKGAEINTSEESILSSHAETEDLPLLFDLLDRGADPRKCDHYAFRHVCNLLNETPEDEDHQYVSELVQKFIDNGADASIAREKFAGTRFESLFP
jgi:hypothetical protein